MLSIRAAVVMLYKSIIFSFLFIQTLCDINMWSNHLFQDISRFSGRSLDHWFIREHYCTASYPSVFLQGEICVQKWLCTCTVAKKRDTCGVASAHVLPGRISETVSAPFPLTPFCCCLLTPA